MVTELLDLTRRVNEKKEFLKEIDKQGFLWGDYLTATAKLFAVIERTQICLEDVSIFEFGAHQCDVTATDNYMPFNPAISHFFATQQEIAVKYFAFDSELKKDHFDMAADSVKSLYLEGTLKHHAPLLFKIYGDVDLEELYEKVLQVSCGNYGDIVKKVKETNERRKLPIIFSNQVLNDPELNKDFPFWNLQGLQIHNCNFVEICNYMDLAEEELAANVKKAHPMEWSLKAERDYRDEFLKRPQEYINRFKQTFKLNGVNLNYFFPDGDMTYYWINL